MSTIQWKRQFIDEEAQETILNGTFPISNELPVKCQEILKYMQWDKNHKDKVNHKTDLNEF